MTDRNRTDVKVIFALTLIHFAGDFYVSFVNPLLPVFVEKFALSLAQVGLIAGMMRMLAFIVQTGIGKVGDRDPLLLPAVLPRGKEVEGSLVEVVNPLEVLPHADRPGERGALGLELLLFPASGWLIMPKVRR
jgi:hypothetical protein